MFFLENCCREWKWRTRKLMLDCVALIDKPHEMGTWPTPSGRSLLQMPRWLFTVRCNDRRTLYPATRRKATKWTRDSSKSSRQLVPFPVLVWAGGANIWLWPRHCSASSKWARSSWHCGMRLLPVTAVRSPSSFLSINANMISSHNVWACMSFKSTSCL